MTAFLLDTHAFIWLVENAPNLPIRLRELIERADIVYILHFAEKIQGSID